MNVLVLYYSMRGHTHRLAVAVDEGAADAGATTRLRRVPELVSDEIIQAVPGWEESQAAMAHVPYVTADDVVWADGIALGSPTRFGGPASQLRQFVDTLGQLWLTGALANKVGTSFTSAKTPHGGHESTILAMNNMFYHWGCAILSLGFHHPVVREQTGNPYGASAVTDGGRVSDAELAVARYQGERLARWAGSLPEPEEIAPLQMPTGTPR